MYKKKALVILNILVALSLSACQSSALTSNQNSESSQTESTAIENGTNESTPEAGLVEGKLPEGGIPEGAGGGLGGADVDTSSITKQETNVAYGTVSDTQTLNIYYPEEGNGPYPVIVAFHGGGFMMGSATGGDVAPMLEGVKHGYAVVSVNYRLSGEAVFPAAVNDAKAAIRFVKANADTYNLDSDKIAVWGDSAGGNLAAMIGTTGNVDTLNGDNTENLEYSSDVQAVVDWFGPLDFLKMDEQFEASGIEAIMGKTGTDTSAESKYIGQNVTEDPELTKQANPETYIDTLTKDSAPSFFIQHGTADQNVPTQQSIDFAEQLTAAIGEDKVTLELIEGAKHGTSEFSEESNLEKVFTFLDSVLK